MTMDLPPLTTRKPLCGVAQQQRRGRQQRRIGGGRSLLPPPPPPPTPAFDLHHPLLFCNKYLSKAVEERRRKKRTAVSVDRSIIGEQGENSCRRLHVHTKKKSIDGPQRSIYHGSLQKDFSKKERSGGQGRRSCVGSDIASESKGGATTTAAKESPRCCRGYVSSNAHWEQ